MENNEILTAEELRAATKEWSKERRVKEAAAANEIFNDFYQNYILPEAKYGHFSVKVPNYQQKLKLTDGGVTAAFFKCLDSLNYWWNVKNVKESDTLLENTGVLEVNWSCEIFD